jgi:predicted glycosyltransferase
MHIWIDLGNSPHAPFFRPLAKAFEQRGHRIDTTARAFAQTVELARAAGFNPAVIGSHGGRNISSKVLKLLQRAWGLAKWARPRKFDLAVSHNSHEQILAAWLLSIPTVTLMDYEHHPANHLSFRLASRVIVPTAFPEASLRFYGVRPDKARRYDGIKEDVYLANFIPHSCFIEKLRALGIEESNILVVARAPASFALYHRMENELFDKLVQRLVSCEKVKLILLSRTPEQRAELRKRHTAGNIIFPTEALDGANLIAAADLVVSAGGTMNREAAALGVPAVTTFAGRWAAVDEQLVREGRLLRCNTLADLNRVKAEKKPQPKPRRELAVHNQVVDLILEGWKDL